MQLKQKVKVKINQLILLPIWVKTLVSVVFLILLVFFSVFLQIKSVKFSYESNTCVQQITLLPGVSRVAGDDFGFEVKPDSIVKFGNFEILSLKTCFKAKKAPLPGNSIISFAPFGGWLARKTFNISVPEPPLVKVGVLSDPIPTMKPLKLLLSGNDSIFDYNLLADGKTAKCPVKDSAIHCEVASLNLLQDTDYKIELVRMFNQKKIETIVSKTIKTLSATNVVLSSVNQDQTVYDNSKIFTFEFDKDILDATVVINKVDGDKRILASSSTKIEKNKATLTVDKDLDRDYRYEFTIDKLEAKDGSTLPAPFILSFNMSDGPSVASVNVGNYGLSTTQTIILTFDQALAENTDITRYVSTSGIATTISRLNNQVYVRYTNASMCTDLSINIKAGLVSSVGVIQNHGWSFTTRTVCHTTSTIGYSKDGRPIIAYIFGSGGTNILYTGAIHGNELSGKYLMDAWVNELEINARSIPADKKIIVVPNLNPDGVAAVRRNNSNNVDLNRNFPTSDWQTDVYSPYNQLIPGGGGASSLSEPESQAIASYTIQLNPRLTLSFHSSASYVIANDAGDSAALAVSYAQLTGYSNMTGVGGAFSYPITGTYDTWLYEKYGLTSLIIELSSSTNAEFARNKPALWAMARI